MYYKNNIYLLLKKYPQIYKDIIKITPNKKIYELIETKLNKTTIKISFNGKSIYLHSRYNPQREAVNIAEENYDLEVENYIIFGLGLGYHVEELMKMAPNSNFHIIETNKDIFRLALDNINLSNIIDNSKVKLYVSDNILEISGMLKRMVSLENIKIVIHNPSLSIMHEELIDIKYLLEELRMLKNSVDSYSLIMEENFKSNIKNYNKNVDVLFNKFNNIPLYIVSAGPSLDKNIQELAKVKDKGLILSVGRAARPLIKAGIYPDLIIITDPSSYLYDMQLKDLDIDIPIIVLSTCDKNVMLSYRGYKLIALQNRYQLAEGYAKEHKSDLVKTGGSVATTALDVAINMGCNPIVFVGQDLAFTNNKSHSDATYSKDINQKNNLREVEDVNGHTVYTSKNLYSYLRWIQNRIAKEQDITFIDATEGGAKIKGTEILTLKEVIEKYSNRDLKEKLNFIREINI